MNIGPEIVLSRERRNRRRGVFGFLAAAVALTTVVLLINPATTEEYAPICGVEAHVHGPECWDTVTECVCPLEESVPHTHTEECYETSTIFICGLEDDPEHIHTEECTETVRTLICGMEEREEHIHTEDCILREQVLICENDDPEHEHTDACYREEIRFLCEEAVRESNAAHVHGELCYAERQVLICDKPEHTHTEECYPALTGDPHADVEIDLDWESTFCDVEKTGIWAEDLVAIARSQIGYAESELNFVTDEFNVRHGYTRYGDWYGNRYVGWNALYVMFCLHYADVWGIPTDSVPANWMNAAKADGFWTEADGEPVMGDLVFLDDNADEIADRVAIVTAVRADEIDILYGATGIEVHEETFPRFHEKISGYLALPTNPDYVTLELPPEEEIPDGSYPDDVPLADLPPEGDGNTVPPEETPELYDPYAPVVLRAETEDGLIATLSALAYSFPYPADELVLKVSEITADDPDYPYGIESVKNAVAENGENVIGERYLDISVWHLETPEPVGTDPGPVVTDVVTDGTADELPPDGMSVEDPSGDELSVEDPAVDELSVEDPSGDELSVEDPSGDELSVEDPSCEDPSFESRSGSRAAYMDGEAFDGTEELESDELYASDDGDGRDVQPPADELPVEEPEDPEIPDPEIPAPEIPGDELPDTEIPDIETPDPATPDPEIPAPEIPAPEIPAPEKKLVRIQLSGPVEITVEGNWGDGRVRVFRIGDENAAEELAVVSDPAAGRITVTTCLN